MPSNGSAVDLTNALEQAVAQTAGLAGNKPVAVVAEYPVHMPGVDDELESLLTTLVALITRTIEGVEEGEIRLHAYLLPAHEVPHLYADVYGDPASLEKGGPWAIVSFDFPMDTVEAKKQGAEFLTIELESPEGAAEDYADAINHVRSTGGDVWLEHDPVEDTRLNLALPLVGAASSTSEDDLAHIAREVETRLPEDSEASHALLLHLQHDGQRELLVKHLAEAGYKVTATENAENVLALARSEKPNLVLLDLLARSPTAFDVAMLLQQDYSTRGIPVLFLTSLDNPDSGVQMGAVNYVVRSNDTGSLVAAVDAVLTSGLSPSSRVLVVEPDDSAREVTVMMIQGQGYRAMEAGGSEEALALAERFEPRMVLVNDGIAQDRDYWLLRGLRQISPNIAIYVLANVPSEAEAEAALRRGASGYRQTGKLPELLQEVRDKNNH